MVSEKKQRVFRKNDTTIYWGDAVSVLRNSVDDGSVDLIFADPPYNIGKRFADFVDRWPSDEAYANWCEEWLDLCVQKLSPTGSLYVMSSTQCMPYIDLYLRKQLHVMSRIVWHYDSSGVQARGYYGSMYEPIVFATKNRKSYTFNAEEIAVEARTGAQRRLIDYRKKVPSQYSTKKVPGNAWYFPRVRYRMPEYEEHPTQKPESLLDRVVRASSNLGDLVLDPFAGTFTTCAVAQRLGRKTIGIELHEEFVKVGLRRLGLRTTYGGKHLQPPKKSFKHKAHQTPQHEPTLFDTLESR